MACGYTHVFYFFPSEADSNRCTDLATFQIPNTRLLNLRLATDLNQTNLRCFFDLLLSPVYANLQVSEGSTAEPTSTTTTKYSGCCLRLIAQVKWPFASAFDPSSGRNTLVYTFLRLFLRSDTQLASRSAVIWRYSTHTGYYSLCLISRLHLSPFC